MATANLRLIMVFMAALMASMLLFYQMELLPSVAITFKDGSKVQMDFVDHRGQSTGASSYKALIDDDGLPGLVDDEESNTEFHSIPGDSGEGLGELEEDLAAIQMATHTKEGPVARTPGAKTARELERERELQIIIDRLADEEEEWERLEAEKKKAEMKVAEGERQEAQREDQEAILARLAEEEAEWERLEEEERAAAQSLEATGDGVVTLNQPPPMVSLPGQESLSFKVKMPQKIIHACHENKVVFEVQGRQSLPAVDLSAGYLYVEMSCTINRTRVALEDELALLDGLNLVTRILPAVPSLANPKVLVATFVADDPLYACSLRAESSLEQWSVEGDTYHELIVEPFLFKSGAWCFNCRGVFNLPVVLPYHFGLKCDHDSWLWDWDEPLSMVAGETFRMWVTPFSWTEAAWAHTGQMEDLLFNVIIRSTYATQAVEVSPTWDADRHGYFFDIQPFDAGTYTLSVSLVVVYGGGDVLTSPKPIIMGSHIRHEYSECDYVRSEVHGSGLEFEVARREDQEEWVSLVSAEDAHYCSSMNAPGRWLRTSASNEPCHVPYCTGNRTEAMVSSMSWQGRIYEDLWVPYDCHFHYFGINDLQYCLEKSGIEWIHVMGDSLPREVAGYLLSLAGVADTNKFETADAEMFGPGSTRVTFQTWADMLNANEQTTSGPAMYRHRWFLKLMLDHYNLLEPETSRSIDEFEFRLQLDPMEGRPDVFIMNPAMAYVLFQQTEESYIQFLDDFLDLTKDMCTIGINGQHPVMCFWYGNPYVWAAAHDKTAFLTQPRNKRFMEMTVPRVEAAGWTVFDPVHITMSRPEESWDGLHYLRGYMEWNGHVASTYIQILLNGILGDCKGSM